MSDIAMMIAIAKKFGGGSSTPAPVVILPETEMTPKETNGVVVGFMGTPTLTAYPEVGKTYTVTVNGTQHNLVAVSEDGMNVFIAPDETWVVLVVQPEYVEQFGCTVAVEWHSEEVPDSLTLSIVQTEGASADSGNGSSGALVVTAVISGDTIGAVTVDSVSATHADMYAAIMSGRDVLCMATHPQVGSPQSTNTTILRPVRADENAIILSCKTAMNSGIEIILQVGANGGSAAIMHS